MQKLNTNLQELSLIKNAKLTKNLSTFPSDLYIEASLRYASIISHVLLFKTDKLID